LSNIVRKVEAFRMAPHAFGGREKDRAPLEIFCSYAPEDEPFRRELERHLSLVLRQGMATLWYDRRIVPGTDWSEAIDAHLETASIILLLVSSDFLASDYCYGIEMQRALQRHKAKEAQVIPIFLRSCDWQSGLFAGLAVLPTDGRPITTWGDRDTAWTNVVKGIRQVLEVLLSPPPTSVPPEGATLVLSDPLRDTSQGYHWQETDPHSAMSCAFLDGAYHLKTIPYHLHPGVAQNTDFENFAYEAEMRILAGDCGGLLFRVNPSITDFYHFRVCQNGTCAFRLYTNTREFPLVGDLFHPAIKAGLNQLNRLAVIAKGSWLSFYVNQQHMGSVRESTYHQGKIGVFAGGGLGHPTEVAFSNARVWSL
jgi:hypothetical protein